MRRKNQGKASNTGFYAFMRIQISETNHAHNHAFMTLQEDDNTKLLQSEDKIDYHKKNLKINLFSSFQQYPGRSTGEWSLRLYPGASGDAWSTRFISYLGRESGLSGCLSPPPLSPSLKTPPSVSASPGTPILLISSTTMRAALHCLSSCTLPNPLVMCPQSKNMSS